MPNKPTSPKEHIQYHKDGSVWAKGKTEDGMPTGYWEWFRLDGTRMRSGHFEHGDPHQTENEEAAPRHLNSSGSAAAFSNRRTKACSPGSDRA
jgi:hypothetical protein